MARARLSPTDPSAPTVRPAPRSGWAPAAWRPCTRARRPAPSGCPTWHRGAARTTTPPWTRPSPPRPTCWTTSRRAATTTTTIRTVTRGAPVPDKFFRSVLPGEPRELPKIDTSVAHIARVYDYWLGSKDNFAIDREVGQKALQAHPETVLSVQANRRFLARSVRHLAAEEGVRQFLDVGTGLPSANNTHEVAQAVAPQSRVVYVDNDPIVLAHARALPTSSAER